MSETICLGLRRGEDEDTYAVVMSEDELPVGSEYVGTWTVGGPHDISRLPDGTYAATPVIDVESER